MLCTWRTSELWLLLTLTVFFVPGYMIARVGSSGTLRNFTQQQMASRYSSFVKEKQRKFTLPTEANTSLSVPVDTKVVLLCPVANLTALLISWSINSPPDKPPCTRAYRRDNNETSERNCTDQRISWESRPDQNPALRIDPVAIAHDGYYRCDMVTPDGNFGHAYHLQVLVPPKVSLYRGSNGTIICSAADGKPAAQISWTPGGDCHTVEQHLDNGTVTVQSTCRWGDHQVSNVSCSVSHVTGNKSLSLDLKPGDQSSLNLTLLCITFIPVTLVIVVSIWLLMKICCFRKCKLKRTEATPDIEEEEMQPYASYTEKNNPLYDTVSK